MNVAEAIAKLAALQNPELDPDTVYLCSDVLMSEAVKLSGGGVIKRHGMPAVCNLLDSLESLLHATLPDGMTATDTNDAD